MKTKNCISLTILCVILIGISFNLGCGASQAAPPPLHISVTVSPTTATVTPNGTQQFTATVTNDSANMGVNWTVTCSTAPCGTVSPTSTKSGVPTTYTAPPNSPSSNVGVVVTATSVATSQISNSANVTLPAAPAIQISLWDDASSLEPGGTAHFYADVQNDPTNSGVKWSVSCTPEGSSCGSVSPDTTPSDAPTTYTAPPSTPDAGLTVTLTATSMANSSISSSGDIPVLGITVSVTPVTGSLIATGTQVLTATVGNDASNSGVNWTVSCTLGPCGTLSSASTASGGSTTYTAPATPPPSDLAVTVTATSGAYSGASTSATITVSAIGVSASPDTALIPLNATQKYTGFAAADPFGQNVTWALSQGGTSCSPACGSVSPSTTNASTFTTYTAPTKMPASSAVTITATSVTDTTKSGSVTITLSAGTVQLVPLSSYFGRVLLGHSEDRSLTLTNVGSSALNITGITMTGTNPGEFSPSPSGTCSSSVAAGATCTVATTFKPTKLGTQSATMLIGDGSSDSPQQVALSGIGYTKDAADMPAVRSALSSVATVAAPLPTGPETVGSRVLALADSTRKDPFLKNGTNRELMVRFWYPATLTKGCKRADYTSPRVWSYFSQLLGMRLPDIMTNSCEDAPVADGIHPVVVFTHGYTGTFTDYTFLFEDLASRGYVVASVDHTYEATAVEFPDGRFAKSKLGSHFGNSWRGDEATLALATQVRLLDLEFVRGELERLNSGVGSSFSGKLDLSRVAIAGHSMGGATALLTLQKDRRFKAGVILDGYLPESLMRPTGTPVLVLTAGGEERRADPCHLWSNLHGPRAFVNLRDAEHLTPSDAVWIAAGAISTGSMGAERSVSAIRDYIAAFLDANLRDRPVDPLLTEGLWNNSGAGTLTNRVSCPEQ